jgi:hypothetical protein
MRPNGRYLGNEARAFMNGLVLLRNAYGYGFALSHSLVI